MLVPAVDATPASYDELIENALDTFDIYEVQRQAFSAKRGWLNAQIDKVRMKDRQSLNRLSILAALEKVDPDFESNLAEFLNEGNALRTAIEKIDGMDFEHSRSADDWYPVIAELQHPELINMAQALFSRNELYSKILIYGEDMAPIDAELKRVREGYAYFVKSLPPSVERLYLEAGLSERVPEFKRRDVDPDWDRIKDWHQREQVFARKYGLSPLTLVFDHSIVEERKRLYKIYSILNSWKLRLNSERDDSPFARVGEDGRSLDEQLSVVALNNFWTSRSFDPNKKETRIELPRLPLQESEVKRIVDWVYLLEGLNFDSSSPSVEEYENRGVLRQTAEFVNELNAIYLEAVELGISPFGKNELRAGRNSRPRPDMMPSYMSDFPEHNSSMAERRSAMIAQRSAMFERHFSDGRAGFSSGKRANAASPLVSLEYLKPYFRPLTDWVDGVDLASLPDSLKSSLVDPASRETTDHLTLIPAAAGEEPPSVSLTAEEKLQLVYDLFEMEDVRRKLAELAELLEMQKPYLLQSLSNQEQRAWDRMFVGKSHHSSAGGDPLSRFIYDSSTTAVVPLLSTICLGQVGRSLDAEISEQTDRIRAVFSSSQSLESWREVYELFRSQPNQLLALRALNVAVRYSNFDDCTKDELFSVVQDFHSLSQGQSQLSQSLEKETEASYARARTTQVADLIDIWDGLEASDGKRHVSRGLLHLVELDQGLHGLYYPVRELNYNAMRFSVFSDFQLFTNQNRHGLGQWEIRQIASFLGELSPWDMPFLGNRVPRAHEFLLEEDIRGLSLLERLWTASKLSALTIEKRRELEQIFNSEQVLGLELPFYNRILCALVFLELNEATRMEITNAILARHDQAPHSSDHKLAYPAGTRSSFPGFSYNDKGMLRLPSADEISGNGQLLIPPLAVIFSNYYKNWQRLIRDDSLAKFQLRERALVTSSLLNASVEDLRRLAAVNADSQTKRLYDFSIQFRESQEFGRLYQILFEQMGEKLDQKLEKGDEKYFVWLYNNLSAGLPKSSMLYVDYINQPDSKYRETLLEKR